MKTAKRSGLLLTGAVAKGAFHAGVLSILAERQMRPSSIGGASAGALNALVFGAGIATGRPRLAAELAEKAWLEHACWSRIMSFSLHAIAHAQGVSSTAEVRAMLDTVVRRVLETSGPVECPPDQDVALHLVASDLAGHDKSDEGPNEPRQTTYEQCFTFRGSHFFNARSLGRMLDCAAASAAFPGVFAPVTIDGRSFMDGGAVNNHPIARVIESAGTERIFVVSALPDVIPSPRSLEGIALAEHIVDVLLSERLFRDLRHTRFVNDRLRWLEEKFTELGLSQQSRDAIRLELGWRQLDIVEIRPTHMLEGGSFAGFAHKRLRADYIEAGHDCARRVLDAIGD